MLLNINIYLVDCTAIYLRLKMVMHPLYQESWQIIVMEQFFNTPTIQNKADCITSLSIL